jgi:hypothetical protein
MKTITEHPEDKIEARPAAPPRRRARGRLAVTTVAALVTGLFVSASLLPSVAFADDEEDVPGEIALKTPFEFIRFAVNGKSSWENHEYTDRRKTLVIMGLDRSDDHTIVLTPRSGEYEPTTITIKSDEFKRTIVSKAGKRAAVYRVVRSVKFEKVKPEAAQPEGANPEGDKPEGAKPEGSAKPEGDKPEGDKPEKSAKPEASRPRRSKKGR